MSQNPTDKDDVIDDLEEQHGLQLTEEEHGRLRRLTRGDLLLLAVLFARAARWYKEEWEKNG